ncbi:hypothetical protein GCM10011346_13610 [Oceanobacillus neutriphilus]|uniref:Uncharacterized protein n=1 Tax=Oceanobacillus neutriphilus TaxID=531815 RepID=A0ABQ2NS21_9BACI|nr:hypothetical protein GCM10011346_13610 [Oceanobacillus neutriphilus]
MCEAAAAADRFAFLGARSSANFCQEEHLAKVDLQMVLIPVQLQASKTRQLPDSALR